MKTLLTLAFVLTAMVGFSQKKSDTLVVDFSKYHYIKIGERVYKIESPTLIEVKEQPQLSIFQPRLLVPYPDTNYKFPTPYFNSNSNRNSLECIMITSNTSKSNP